ncbi:MAG: Fe-S cluster assembly protein SufD [Deltaproteobacteria bacterium]|nr:Fe-S cluster assembly protein SufD [Deltaproteobacteria bacterium]
MMPELKNLEHLPLPLNTCRPQWLANIQQRAKASFDRLGFPTKNMEEWKYTDFSSLSRRIFEWGAGPAATDLRDISFLEPFTLLDEHRLILWNGGYSRVLSRVEGLPTSVRAGSLAQFMEKDPTLLEAHFTRYADSDRNAFCAMNTATFRDGAFVHIPPGVHLHRPIHILFISSGLPEKTILSLPRTLVVAEEGSEATIIESHIGWGASGYLSNGVCEIVVGKNAQVEHVLIIKEHPTASHLGYVQVFQQRESRFRSHSFSLDGALIRNDFSVGLGGENTECTLNGLFTVAEGQHVDTHTFVNHKNRAGRSRQLFKGIVQGQATGVFNGAIVVAKEALQTDAEQSNQNLLLSEQANVFTKPQLEISANDVKCRHGSATGPLDESSLFYLRSRGLGEHQANHLLTCAFAEQTIEGIKSATLKSRVSELIAERVNKFWKGAAPWGV